MLAFFALYRNLHNQIYAPTIAHATCSNRIYTCYMNHCRYEITISTCATNKYMHVHLIQVLI